MKYVSDQNEKIDNSGSNSDEAFNNHKDFLKELEEYLEETNQEIVKKPELEIRIKNNIRLLFLMIFVLYSIIPLIIISLMFWLFSNLSIKEIKDRITDFNIETINFILLVAFFQTIVIITLISMFINDLSRQT